MLAVELYTIISSEESLLEFLQKNKLLPQNNETNLCHKFYGETKMYIRTKRLTTSEIRESPLYDVSQKDVRHIYIFYIY